MRIGRWNIVLADKICTIINWLYSPRGRLTITKVLLVMSTFSELARRPEPESRIWQFSTHKVKGKQFKQLTEKFCSDFLGTCIMVSGNKGGNGLRVAKDMF